MNSGFADTKIVIGIVAFICIKMGRQYLNCVVLAIRKSNLTTLAQHTSLLLPHPVFPLQLLFLPPIMNFVVKKY